MAKTKKGKKDPEKKAALQAKKEAKAEKAARKRLVKEARGAGGMEITDQDGHSGTTDPVSSKTRSAVRALAEIYQQQELPPTETVMIQSLGVGIFPPARANTTLTITTGKKVKQSDLYLFGGEYYDGVENIVLNQLYKYDWMEWRRIHCPAPIPPPRCAHTTVFYNGCLYVTGGELATAEEYHHYRDVWKFNTVTNAWTEILSTPTATKRKPGPSPRSGHAAAVWKHFMIVLGGFYEAARDAPRWFNDVHVMDLRTEQWLDIAPTPSRLSIQPEPRSATNCVVWNDVLVVHGGFSKVLDKARATPSTIASQTVPAETVVYSDTWLLHLKPILTGNPPTWERYLSSSSSSSSSTKQRLHHHHPTGRSGMGCCLYQDRTMLVYGGVRDTEKQNHQIDSIFFNDLFALHLDRKKWFPIHTRKNGTVLVVEEAQGVITTTDDVDDGNHNKNSSTSDTFTKDGSTVVEEELDDAEDSDDDHVQAHGGWDLDKLRSNMFAFIDGSGNLVYEKIDEDHDEDGELHNDETGRKMPPEDTRNQSNADDDEEKEETKEDDDSSSDQSAGDIVKTNASNPTSTLTMRSPSLRSKPKRSAPSKKGMVQDSAILPSITASSVMALDPITRMPVAVQRSEPLPRIKACTFVNGGLLYVYGGILEVGDREITLDDFWSFDLRRRDAWRCLFPGTMHQQVWRGAIHNDDDSYVSSSTGRRSEEDEEEDDVLDDDEDSLNSDNGNNDEEEITVTSRERKAGSHVLKAEIAELNQKYELINDNRTPLTDESLSDFYARTSDYWNQQAAAMVTSTGEPLSSKELKRQGFSLARERFAELEPILARLRNVEVTHSKDAKAGSKHGHSSREKKKKSS